mgnify:CR=1 FL=1
MAKVTLQSVGEDVVAFNDQAYWVADNVKRFLNNFQPGMEVELTVKEINGTPTVTFIKKAGVPIGGDKPAFPKPASAPTSFQTPSITKKTIDGAALLAAAIIVKNGLDPVLVKTVAEQLLQS